MAPKSPIVMTDRRYRERLIPVMVRMPEAVRTALAEQANKSRRSVSAEAVRAIEEALRMRSALRP